MEKEMRKKLYIKTFCSDVSCRRTSGRDQLISRRRRRLRRTRQSVEQPVVIGHRLLFVTGQCVNVVAVRPFGRDELEVRRHFRCQQHHTVKGLVLGRGHRQIVRFVYIAADPQGVRDVHQHRRRGARDRGVRVTRVTIRRFRRQSGLAVVVGSRDVCNS